MVERCFRCGVSGEEIRLYDGLYGFENVKACENCSNISGITIIKVPTTEQLKESEKPYAVRERLARLVGMKLVDKTTEAIKNVKESEKIKLPEPLVKPKDENLVFKLIDNFHWVIQRTRRRKGITIKQMAETIKESQAALEMLEKGKIPGNSLDMIMKVEQFLGISLIKRKITDNALFGSVGSGETFLEKKREEEMEEIIIDKKREENIKRLTELAKNTSDKSVDFSRHSLHGVTISDLKRINQQIEKDTTKKTALELGEEQFENFGKENMEKIKGKIEREEDRKSANKTPSIYDLMKIKQEKDKRIVGKDIEIAKEEPKNPERDYGLGGFE